VVTWLFALWGCIALSLIFGVLTCFIIFFFRDPDPQIPEGENLILAPAHGKVVSIKTLTEPDFVEKEMQCVSIFLSIFDCHVNRNPYPGTIKSTKYRPGKFNLAFTDHASDENERFSILLETEDNKSIVVSLITGFLARRIVPLVKMGDRLSLAERIGLIRFGSRVDIYLPEDVNLTVGLGDKVTGGQTIIGEFTDK
ncbi:MAG: phosphatidylserine decarboxylase family protein, partial [Candidatus Dadabacteria bacterium]|nr:phosphatidylserine decarboxylase family protein [Candidatus Dadabacteria bacterium]NIS08266.1 phosphatidylserine decarboxylase family protein [Candidatus Dadabacteria bacterium]NIY21751.1 phosphatidylserine decarboxylase family protein [Candidatus Dadabacteria bacterium]